MIQAWPTKDPSANLRYWFDWSAFVEGEESEIVSYEISLDSPPDNALLIGNHAREDNVVMVWISGGTLGKLYHVRCRITLADGTIEDESRGLVIRQH